MLNVHSVPISRRAASSSSSKGKKKKKKVGTACDETNQSKWPSFCLCSRCSPGPVSRIMRPHGPAACPLGLGGLSA